MDVNFRRANLVALFRKYSRQLRFTLSLLEHQIIEDSSFLQPLFLLSELLSALNYLTKALAKILQSSKQKKITMKRKTLNPILSLERTVRSVRQELTDYHNFSFSVH